MALAAFAYGLSSVASAATIPRGVADALAHEDDTSYCVGQAHAASSLAFAQASYQASNVTLHAGPHLVVLFGGGACQCGNANCKLEVFRQNGDAYSSVLATYAIGFDVRPDGAAVIEAHDSAAVSVRTTYRWTGDTYGVEKNELVLADPKTVKPQSRRVQFAAGASEALLTGDRVQAGFEDNFDFTAAAGQPVTLTLVAADRHFESFALAGADFNQLRVAHSGSIAVMLPASGTYRVVVSGADQTFTKYALKIEIR